MSKRKLLLADDSVTIQKVINLTFADEGVDVITVGDGDSAMEMIGQAAPDVVLADVHMPGLSGYQICERLRQDPHTRDLPVVLLVGSFEPFDEGEAARVGANAYLTKPFQSIRQLVTQVSDLMNASGPQVEQHESAYDQHQDDDGHAATVDHGAPYPDPDEEPTAQMDTTDIESLYSQSVGSQGGEEAGPPTYVDAGMDDEMIETRYVDDEADTDPNFQVSPATEPSHEAEYARDENYQASGPFDSVARDSTEAAGARAAQAHGDYDPYSATDQMPSAATLAQQIADVMPQVQRDMSLDESDLLELPPLGPADAVHVAPPGAGAEGQRVVTMAPELVDMIVQKVVERLSEKS